MQALIERVRTEAVYLGKGIVKVDGFLNHQVDPVLLTAIGAEFMRRFAESGCDGLTKVVTAEASGIAPAFATAQVLGVPLLYARKQRPVTMPEDAYTAETLSRTRGEPARLFVSSRYLTARDRVVLIDDFLGTGTTLQAMLSLVAQSGAALLGLGCVVEKVYEGGRDRLGTIGVPMVSLARIDLVDDTLVVY